MTFKQKQTKIKTFRLNYWQQRLNKLRQTYHVPGASLAVLVNGEIHEIASGVLHRGTGVSATTDSVFQVGSITKIHTATLVMQLVDSEELDLDAKVKDILPEFAVPDEGATEKITVRQLLSHTGGLTCDFTKNTGRGDDCLALYVEASKEVGLDCPPGKTISYSSVGYNILGRIVEVLTGQTWDEALRDRLLCPLGLASTVTLPEDVLRFRAAMGHLGEEGQDPDPAPTWNALPRSSGPYGGVLCATASDIVKLAQLHLNGGMTPDGAQLLTPETVATMQQREIETPDKWTVSSDAWGLGWTLYDWDGVSGFGHDGATIGQYGYLRVVPSAGVAIALLTNGGGARLFYSSLFRELLGELANIKMPDDFQPSKQPPIVDITPYQGIYKREGVKITIDEHAGKPHVIYEFVDGMKDLSPPLKAELVPISANVFAARAGGSSFSEDWMPVVFSTLADGSTYCYIGMRAAPKIS